MPYSTIQKGQKIVVPDLAADGRNWLDYKKKILLAAKTLGLTGLLDSTETKPTDKWNFRKQSEWMGKNNEAQYLLITTTAEPTQEAFESSQPAHEFYSVLRNRFNKPTTATTKPMVEYRNACDCTEIGKISTGPQVEKSFRSGKHRERSCDTENPQRVEPEGWRGEKTAIVSSPDNDSEDMEVQRMSVVPQEPETAGQQVKNETADTTNPSVTHAGLVVPADRSHDPQTSAEARRTDDTGEMGRLVELTDVKVKPDGETAVKRNQSVAPERADAGIDGQVGRMSPDEGIEGESGRVSRDVSIAGESDSALERERSTTDADEPDQPTSLNADDLPGASPILPVPPDPPDKIADRQSEPRASSLRGSGMRLRASTSDLPWSRRTRRERLTMMRTLGIDLWDWRKRQNASANGWSEGMRSTHQRLEMSRTSWAANRTYQARTPMSNSVLQTVETIASMERTRYIEIVT